ncbi:hypothetical protein [Sphaerimonospora thailandensis]|uniref:Lipoprotein n=1 Tax=Sphaerimonospora thailandensis TaxID=795644 RepID=A0A8J3RBJ3_9ACTN|nr:hypothetical protein [Sphaerimonospora thailandensis]GIH71580.1 hypothetical protein Mth01_38330 [Sphaerimonospora thailandensis]
MTTFDLFRRAAVPAAAAVTLLSLAACSGADGSPAPAVTVTVTATPSEQPAEPSAEPSAEAPTEGTPAPEGSASPGPAAQPTEDDERPPISAKTPPIHGEVIQSDPGHDFTKGIGPSRDGIVRGEMRAMQDANVAEYVPVRFVREYGGSTTGHFEGPPEGDVTAFAAPIAKDVVFLSAAGCDGKDQTIDGNYLGTQRCSRDRLVSLTDKGGLYALITVKNRQIVKVVQIYAA